MTVHTELAAVPPAKKSLWRRLWRVLLYLMLSFIIGSIVLVLILRFVPPPTTGVMIQRTVQAWSDEQQTQRRRYYWVDQSAMTPSAALAVIASEDQLFFQHNGFDFSQLEKALADNKRGKRLRGASTISQQAAKNLFLWGSRSYVRKALEVWFTVLMEALWPKSRIVETYLNIVEFGPGIYGIEAASLSYFRKHAKDLNRHEAALLAAVLPNPHRLHAARPSPYVRERQQWILKQMAQLGSVKQLQQQD